MTTSPHTLVALLPAEDGDFGAIIQLLILVILPALWALGKVISEKGKKGEAARREQRRPIPPLPEGTEGVPVAAEQPEPEDVEVFWDELVAAAREEPPSSGGGPATARPLPLPSLEGELEVEPLGIDLTAVEESLPSGHDELFRSRDLESLPGARVPKLVEGRVARVPDAGRAVPSRARRITAAMGRPGSWRRAVILSEVLEAPLGLREEARMPGMR